jgi:hypothetical protein
MYVGTLLVERSALSTPRPIKILFELLLTYKLYLVTHSLIITLATRYQLVLIYLLQYYTTHYVLERSGTFNLKSGFFEPTFQLSFGRNLI